MRDMLHISLWLLQGTGLDILPKGMSLKGERKLAMPNDAQHGKLQKTQQIHQIEMRL